jgi:hypothetical protein
VVPEIFSGGLASIKCPADQGNLPDVLNSKFRAAQCVILLGAQSLQACIPNVNSEDIHAIQGGARKAIWMLSLDATPA